MKYIDNTRRDQKLVSLLSIGEEQTRHGVKYRLRKGTREIESAYSIIEALNILRNANAVIIINNENSELFKAVNNAEFIILDLEPFYNYIDTSHNIELELI